MFDDDSRKKPLPGKLGDEEPPWEERFASLVLIAFVACFVTIGVIFIGIIASEVL